MRTMSPVDPWKTAFPKAKMPPSLPTIQYPAPLGAATDPTSDPLSLVVLMSPKAFADPNVSTLPRSVKVNWDIPLKSDGVTAETYDNEVEIREEPQ